MNWLRRKLFSEALSSLDSLSWVKYIIVHHSLTEDGKSVSWGIIDDWHTGRNIHSPYHFKEIGYHAGVEEINGRYYVLLGRSILKKGAHCKDGGRNKDSLGFCYVGNWDKIEPDEARLLIGIQSFIVPMMKICHLGVEDIKFHRDYADKTCPGKLFSKVRFLGLVEQEMRKR